MSTAHRPHDPLGILLAVAGVVSALRTLALLGRAGRRRHRLEPAPARPPSAEVSVVVPARDEAVNIAGCVRALSAQTLAPVEVLVVDDGSRDATAARAAAIGATVLRAPALATGSVGKAAACAVGAAAARGRDWLGFVDADVRLGPTALARLVGAGERSGAAAVSAFLRPVGEAWWEQLVVPELGLAVAAALDLDAVADPERPDAFLSGQCMLVRRAAYEAVGGFAAVGGSLVEDLALARRLKASGARLDLRLAPGIGEVRMFRRPAAAWGTLERSLVDVWGASPSAVLRRVGWVLGGLAPWLALARRPRRGTALLALVGAGLQLAARAGGRSVSGADPRWAAGYPAADAALLAGYLTSVAHRRLGLSVQWRGRRYVAAQGAR